MTTRQGLPRSTIENLSPTDWDVTHTADIGLSRATDQEIIQYAKVNDRVIVTLDADFHALLIQNGNAKPSVIRIRKQGLRGKELAELLTIVVQKTQVELESGAMVSVSQNKIRIHHIPISTAKGS